MNIENQNKTIPKMSEIEMIKINDVKAKAIEVLETLTPNFLPKEDIKSTLESYPWPDVVGDNTTQEELSQINQELNPRSCLGRAALSFAILEKYFKGQADQFEYGEVLEDWFWNTLMTQWRTYYEPKSIPLPEGWVNELLTYEEPHAVMVGRNDFQFEPLSTLIKKEVRHPKTNSYPIWPAITSAFIVSEAISEKDPMNKLKLLEDAEKICPNTALVKQNRIEPLILLGRDEEARSILKEIIAIKPNSRAFFMLETLFDDKSDMCNNIYTSSLWSQIKDELESEI